MTKAKVEILEQRNSGKIISIAADVTINGKVTRKTFSVDNGLNSTEIIEIISNKIKEDRKIELKGINIPAFEVEL